MALRSIDQVENRRRMENGELYFSFAPNLIADRQRCRVACFQYNSAGDAPRRKLVELFQKIANDTSPLPPQAQTPEEDEDLFAEYVWCDGPIKMDYGYNVKFGKNVYVNSNSTWVDSSPITIGDRTLIAPNCSFYSGRHPTDPRVRNGMIGPEDGAPITIGEDCWIGGNCVVLPGVTIGRGCTVGAGSVVTKDIPPFMIAVGNPARVLKPVREVPSEELPPGYIPPQDIPTSSQS